MLKILLSLFIVFAFIALTPTFGQDTKTQTSVVKESAAEQAPDATQQPKTQSLPQEETIKGTIKEIAADGSSMVVDTTKVLVTKELLEDSYLEVGDKVEVIVEKTDAGPRVKSCNYIFEEESMSNSEEGVSGEENLPKEY
ncbi:MAG: hypothetical protein Q8O30_04505 [Candidatus Omnitrophota bacterium]|nr:hypothetical protein [Candidatus Omnitrophota bacterium]